jgi:hypothetical protein
MATLSVTSFKNAKDLGVCCRGQNMMKIESLINSEQLVYQHDKSGRPHETVAFQLTLMQAKMALVETFISGLLLRIFRLGGEGGEITVGVRQVSDAH